MRSLNGVCVDEFDGLRDDALSERLRFSHQTPEALKQNVSEVGEALYDFHSSGTTSPSVDDVQNLWLMILPCCPILCSSCTTVNGP